MSTINFHQEIIGKQPSFDDVADVASALMQVVSEDDAEDNYYYTVKVVGV